MWGGRMEKYSVDAFAEGGGGRENSRGSRGREWR